MELIASGFKNAQDLEILDIYIEQYNYLTINSLHNIN